jgi:hypothetical protein
MNGIRDSMLSPRVKREPHSSPAFFRSRLEVYQHLSLKNVEQAYQEAVKFIGV